MGRARKQYERDEKSILNLGRKTLGKETIRTKSADGRKITLKWILKKYTEVDWVYMARNRDW
jgi:hypothetical protein